MQDNGGNDIENTNRVDISGQFVSSLGQRKVT